MIDIHCHILPGLDDGARTLSDSLAMARQAAKQGIRQIIATPHHMDGIYTNEPDKVKKTVQLLNSELEHMAIPVHISAGHEIRIHPQIVSDLQHGKALTLADSHYVLVELPNGPISTKIYEIFYEMQVAGYTPIIAHPERSYLTANRMEKLEELVEHGVLCQVTGLSLIGGWGKKIQEFTKQLCRRNLVHFVASDAHDASARSFRMDEVTETIRKDIGFEQYEHYLRNAQYLTEDGSIETLEPIHTRRRFKLFAGWKRQ